MTKVNRYQTVGYNRCTIFFLQSPRQSNIADVRWIVHVRLDNRGATTSERGAKTQTRTNRGSRPSHESIKSIVNKRECLSIQLLLPNNYLIDSMSELCCCHVYLMLTNQSLTRINKLFARQSYNDWITNNKIFSDYDDQQGCADDVSIGKLFDKIALQGTNVTRHIYFKV